MSRPGPTTRAVISLALWPLIIIFSPVIVLAGEPVNRYVMRQVRRSASTAQIPVVRHRGRAARAAAVRLPLRTSLLLTVISNPLWIALTAPGRWVSDRFRGHPTSRRTGERTLTGLVARDADPPYEHDRPGSMQLSVIDGAPGART
jgi:hypothetical protein